MSNDFFRVMFLQMVLPIAVGILLTRSIVYIVFHRVGARAVRFSPNAVSVMVGMLLYVAFLFAFLMLANGFRTIGAAVASLLSALWFSLPIVIIMGPLLGVYLFGVRQGQSPVPNYAIYATSSACFVAQAFWFAEILTH